MADPVKVTGKTVQIDAEEYAKYQAMMAKKGERKVKSLARRKAMAELKKTFKKEFDTLVIKNGGKS